MKFTVQACLFDFAIVVVLVSGSDNPSRSEFVRQGGTIIEFLGDVAILQDVVKVQMNISSIRTLPVCLNIIRNELSFVNNTAWNLASVGTTDKRLLQLRMEKAFYLIDDINTQLLPNSTLMTYMESFSRKTTRPQRGTDTGIPGKEMSVNHHELSGQVELVCSSQNSFPNPPSAGRTRSWLYVNDVTTNLTALYTMLKNMRSVIGDFREGMKAASEGRVLYSLLPLNKLNYILSQASSRWHLKPVWNTDDEPHLYYNLLECSFSRDFVLFIIPFQRKESFVLSRLLPFPVASKDSVLIMNVDHDLILTSDDFKYAHPSQVDLQDCKTANPRKDFCLCHASPFVFYEHPESPSCESDVFFKLSSVSSCTYSKFSMNFRPFSAHLGSSHYLFFPKPETVAVICPLKNAKYHLVQGAYVLDDSCELRQTDLPYMILLPDTEANDSLNHSQALTNISNLMEIPGDWDISELKIISDENLSQKWINVLLALNVFTVVNLVALVTWICIYGRPRGNRCWPSSSLPKTPAITYTANPESVLSLQNSLMNSTLTLDPHCET